MFSLRSKPKSSDDGAYHVEVSVSNRTLLRIFLVIFVFILAVAAVKQAASALLLLFTSFFLALALNAPVHWIAEHLPGKRRGSRSLATTLSVLLVLAAFAAFLSAVVPPFVRQIGGLVDSAPSFIRDLKDSNSQAGGFIDRYNLGGQVDDFTHDLSSRLQNFAGSTVEVVSNIGNSAIATLTVLVLTFMMLVEGPRWVAIGQRLVPSAHRSHVTDLGRAMYKVIKGYVNGQVFLAAVAAVAILPVFLLMHVSYPVALMVLVFICGLVPMVGHTLGAIIATGAALLTSPFAAAVVFIYYVSYQQIENYLVQPKIQSNSTNMSPLLVFASVVLGVSFGGLLGGLVAIPVMGCVRILVLDQLTRRHILESNTVKKAAKKAKAEARPAAAGS